MKKSREILPLALVAAVMLLVGILMLLKSPRATRTATTAPSNTIVSESAQSPSESEPVQTQTGTQAPTQASTKAQTRPTATQPADAEGIEALPAVQVIAISDSNLAMTLVNRKYRIPDEYTVNRKPCIPGSDVELEARAADAYTAMYNAAKADGCTLTPVSGYRRYSTQKTNYENKTQYYINQGYTRQQALTLAARIIMPPGSSEHNLGLAMDICSLEESFDQTKEFRWLKENAETYGFIMRYKKEKQDITKVSYEPWHWRYVGVANAKVINQSGQCLEEFLGKDAG